MNSSAKISKIMQISSNFATFCDLNKLLDVDFKLHFAAHIATEMTDCRLIILWMSCKVELLQRFACSAGNWSECIFIISMLICGALWQSAVVCCPPWYQTVYFQAGRNGMWCGLSWPAEFRQTIQRLLPRMSPCQSKQFYAWQRHDWKQIYLLRWYVFTH